MIFLTGVKENSLRTWPEIRTSNDLWPVSETCCGRFHSCGLILHSNKCSAWSHCPTQGCVLEVPQRETKAQCLGCAGKFLRGSKWCPPLCHLKRPVFHSGKGRGREDIEGGEGVKGLPGCVCMTVTDGQLDSHNGAFWCHPHATYASPSGYDFLEIEIPHNFSQPSPWLHSP